MDMNQVLTLIANFGFPIVVAVLLLTRLETKLEKLTTTLSDLDKVIAELKTTIALWPRTDEKVPRNP